MDVKILHNWLKERLDTNAGPFDIARALSLTSASIEKIDKFKGDDLYTIEVTTNRPDMASIIGFAREAAVSLPQFGFKSTLTPLRSKKPTIHGNEVLEIISNDALVKRICAVVMEVNIKESPYELKDRLESAGIRSLNNAIDITNYVMLETGHPCHVFDYDRLSPKKLVFRESKKGEEITTLDGKIYSLPGGDIVIENGEGKILDLPGIMGLENSVVTNETKRIIFFINNDDQHKIRKTSMKLGIRTEAAALNEKGIDPELAEVAFYRGIELYEELADGKVISQIIDIYPHPYQAKTITLSHDQIEKIIGIRLPIEKAIETLEILGFGVSRNNTFLTVTIPSWRAQDIEIAQDIIEEVARIYGYHNLPSMLPPMTEVVPFKVANYFYWDKQIKEALKFWGLTETYTYSMISEELLDGPTIEAITLKNPLDEKHTYMRTTLTSSLDEVAKENSEREDVEIFEIATVYHKKASDLPDEKRHLAILLKGKRGTFFHAKGLIEKLAQELNVEDVIFTDVQKAEIGASIQVAGKTIGEIIVMDDMLVTLELDIDNLIHLANRKKIYKLLTKYPPLVEDLSLIAPLEIKTGEIVNTIANFNTLISQVTLLDQYKNSRTFHIVYQSPDRNLTSDEITSIRENLIRTLHETHGITLKTT